MTDVLNGWRHENGATNVWAMVKIDDLACKKKNHDRLRWLFRKTVVDGCDFEVPILNVLAWYLN